MLRVFAPAKVNLCLHVTGQRADGYHLLDSIVGFADVGDVLEMSFDRQAGLTVAGPESASLAGSLSGADNIITRCLDAFGGQGVRVNLTKNLPVAAGIGGGSSDAAAAWRGICALMGRGALAQDQAKLLALGADVPMCALAAPARIQGIGEVITPLPGLAPLHAVLVNPRLGVATPSVFKALENRNNAPLAVLPQRLDHAETLIQFLMSQRNDLQAPAQTLAPVVGDVLAALVQTGAAGARMSGSGATCFGLYPSATAAAKAADKLRQGSPDWWVAGTVINGPIDIAPQVIRATT